MATLEASFYADIDELSDNEVDAGKEEEEDIDVDMAVSETLNYDDLESVSKLQKTQRYADIMKKVEQALEEVIGTDPEYKLIVDCNQLSVDIENEIVIVHNFIRDKYRRKFQELESLIHDPIDYARVVKKIGNETDLTLVNLEDLLLLKPATIISVSLTALTTKGNPLPDDILQKTLDACDRALNLDSARKKVLDFLESKMGYIAPNLSAIVGSAVAAKLMGTAGGLTALAKMPACNVLVLGHKRKNLDGFSTATSQSRVGYLEQTEIVQSTPPGLRMRASRLLASKSTLAARVDATRGDASGTNGKALREQIRKNIDKWQERPPGKQPTPLPVPYSEPKKKRGGRRLRKTKERYQVTDIRKLANRMAFGTPEESSLGDGYGDGYGLGARGCVSPKSVRTQVVPGGATTSGLRTSSLAFTLVQGIELCNPQAIGLGSGSQSSYFSESGTFSKFKKI
ncbi:hypothetical protein ARALYDRAFT_331322 [Arabidopsis lyrata subsp. lyrata]|uniref:Nop domain-containing protein n=1 Tax=Arabidopsis lyrata subsp. lyrata TaxID=81972 RepID=D7MN74_ARALL|nr:hypothetical protein ARALYDRAFT_331322 [Arabidopsis lyrata subsp. lyrata]